MRQLFKEVVLTYKQADREAWNVAKGAAKSSLIPAFHEMHPTAVKMIDQQPRNHFGEFRTLHHYHSTEGWLGFRFYVLAYLPDLKNPRFTAGGLQVRKIFPRDKLEAYIRARGAGRTDRGDPDLFLYKATGEAMFLEVKVAQDQLDEDGSQLQSLAQIRSILGCRAEVVHLIEETKRYKPKTYWVDQAQLGIIPLAHGLEA
jgi:hypothetical protein